MVVDRISKVVAVAALLAIPAWGEDDILVNKPDFVVFRPKMPISWQRRNPDSPRTPQEMRMTGVADEARLGLPRLSSLLVLRTRSDFRCGLFVVEGVDGTGFRRGLPVEDF